MKMLKWQQLAARSLVAGAALVSFAAAAASSVPSFKDAPKLDGDREFCLDQQDGAYEHPDCRVHYQCAHHLAAEVKCPEGQVFDASKNPDGDPARSYCAVPESASHVDCSGLALHK